MSEPNVDNPVVVLNDDESWELLGTERIGRLVVVSGGRPDVFPINYAVRDRKLYFRTAEGSKLVELTVHAEVAFEADHVEQDRAWSVVLHGRARNLALQRDPGGRGAGAAGLGAHPEVQLRRGHRERDQRPPVRPGQGLTRARRQPATMPTPSPTMSTAMPPSSTRHDAGFANTPRSRRAP